MKKMKIGTPGMVVFHDQKIDRLMRYFQLWHTNRGDAYKSQGHGAEPTELKSDTRLKVQEDPRVSSLG